MKKFALLVFLLPSVICARGQNRVTADQLEQRIAQDSGRADKDLAHRLENVQLTQRLSTSRLQKLESTLPGPESRTALLAVTDLAEFLDPPAGEISSDAPPTATEQQQILSRALAEDPAGGPLPDFDATAEITRFRNVKFIGADPADPDCRLCVQSLDAQRINPMAVVVPVPLEVSGGTDRIAVRQGRLIVTHPRHAWAPGGAISAGADDWEGLYSVRSNLLHDLRSVQPKWVRWEKGPSGNLAVFEFSIAEVNAHLLVHTVIDPQVTYPTWGNFTGNCGYRAEIAVNPATGALHRFRISAALNSHIPVTRADVAVEFATANVEGKSFLAPLRAITVGVSRTLLVGGSMHSNADIRPVMHLIDVEFRDYRIGLSNAVAAGDRGFLAAAMQVKRERVTIDQLEKLLGEVRDHTDTDIADRLGRLELAQRLTPERYDRLRHLLPGNLSADALRALYDLSAFADLPPIDVAIGRTPDAKQQGDILRSAVQFVAGVTHKMPDLFATRQLARFEDLQVVRGIVQPPSTEVKPLVMVDQSSGTVQFREGREVVETELKGVRQPSTEMGLDTWGTFGPILEMVMRDVLNSKVGWSHWEHGPAGALAVLRYAVSQDTSHYAVRFCCYLAEDGSASSFAAKPGYHGELAIDPASGAILRLVLMADLKPGAAQPDEQSRNPVLRSDVLMEYGEVNIRGKKYICPKRSVSAMTSWTLGSQGPVKENMSKAEGAKAAKKALALMEFSRVNAINEALFVDYHVFRSEMRIVSEPGNSPPDAKKQ
jgi:hypothetical protein